MPKPQSMVQDVLSTDGLPAHLLCFNFHWQEMSLDAFYPSDFAIWNDPALEPAFAVTQHICEDMLFLNLWVVASAAFIDPPYYLFDVDISISTILMSLNGNITAKILCGEFYGPFVSGSYAP